MEKFTPHCKLNVVKALVTAGQVRTTPGRTAREGAVALGFDLEGMFGGDLGADDKPISTRDRPGHADHRIWQDVYRPMTAAGGVYLKLTVIDDVLIVSFKEL